MTSIWKTMRKGLRPAGGQTLRGDVPRPEGGRMACKRWGCSEPLPLSELPPLGAGQEGESLKYRKNGVSHSFPVQTRKPGNRARAHLSSKASSPESRVSSARVKNQALDARMVSTVGLRGSPAPQLLRMLGSNLAC